MYVKTVEHHQGYKVACLEEIAFNNHWISKQALEQSLPAPANSACKQRLQTAPANSAYSQYLTGLVETPSKHPGYEACLPTQSEQCFWRLAHGTVPLARRLIQSLPSACRTFIETIFF